MLYGFIKMTKIESVRGPIDTSKLGVTLMHEHIFVLSTEINQNYPESWGDEERRVQDAVEQLRKLKSRGVDTIVDATVLGLGRCIPRIQRIAAQVDLNILVAAGLYVFNDLPMYLQFRTPGSRFHESDILIDMFLRDIREGIADTGVKAAILKCATDCQGVTRGVERVLRAVAMAHRKTGAPITTHTDARTQSGLAQQRIFEEEGVDLSRVLIGHCGDTTNLKYLETLMEKGSLIGMDRFGIEIRLPFKKRVEVVAALCRQGYATKMVLSQDAACYNDWFNEQELAARAPRWSYVHIFNDVIPALKELGVTDGQIRTMLVENPRRFFEGNASC
jgi:phosphotriesterase-related protein